MTEKTSINIETHDQEGGTNIGQVNVDSPNDEDSPLPKTPFQRWWPIVVGIVSVGAGIVVIVEFLGG